MPVKTKTMTVNSETFCIHHNRNPWTGEHVTLMEAEIAELRRRQEKAGHILLEKNIRYVNIANRATNPDQTCGHLSCSLKFGR